MILLTNGNLILSYNPYVYKQGGFCIVIKPNNQISMEEVFLDEWQKRELISSQNHLAKNHIPIYKDLLNEYFNQLAQTELIL